MTPRTIRDTTEQRVALGRRIRAWRVRRDLSQAGLARLAGVTQSTLSNYENGKRDLSVSILIRIADELDVDLEDLTGRAIRRRRDGPPRERMRD
ncbi:MAG: helix-turn-helix transcriptional regulator [Dehalococcoidia bacterium]